MFTGCWNYFIYILKGIGYEQLKPSLIAMDDIFSMWN